MTAHHQNTSETFPNISKHFKSLVKKTKQKHLNTFQNIRKNKAETIRKHFTYHRIQWEPTKAHHQNTSNAPPNTSEHFKSVEKTNMKHVKALQHSDTCQIMTHTKQKHVKISKSHWHAWHGMENASKCTHAHEQCEHTTLVLAALLNYRCRHCPNISSRPDRDSAGQKVGQGNCWVWVHAFSKPNFNQNALASLHGLLTCHIDQSCWPCTSWGASACRGQASASNSTAGQAEEWSMSAGGVPPLCETCASSALESSAFFHWHAPLCMEFGFLPLTRLWCLFLQISNTISMKHPLFDQRPFGTRAPGTMLEAKPQGTCAQRRKPGRGLGHVSRLLFNII